MAAHIHAENEWQPIETAPRDSRKVIALISVAGPKGYITDPWTGWIEADGKASRWPHPFPPTHWFHLPPAPKSEPQP